MKTSISPQQTALLQTMGIDVYKRVESLDVSEFGWMSDVCDLLKIERDKVVFGGAKIHYDKSDQVLYLPANFYDTESNLKQSIWREIQPFVYFDG